MSYKWIYGTFGNGQGTTSDGSTAPENVIPFVAGDTATVNVLGEDNATFKFPSDQLSNWKTKLRVGGAYAAMINEDLAWDHPQKIVYAGPITKLQPALNDTVAVKCESILFYLKSQVMADLYNNVVNTPSIALTFSADTWQGVMRQIVVKAFSNTGVPAGVRPANVLGTVNGSNAGTAHKYEAKYSDFQTYGDALEEIRDQQSFRGNEVVFIPRFTSSAMKRIVWDCWIGNDTSFPAAHYQESTTRTITIESEANFNKLTELSTTYDIAGIANRYVAQSKFGDADTNSGADLTGQVNLSSGLPRWDTTYNPGVELTEGQMTDQLTARLNFSTDFAEASYVVAEQSSEAWFARLGNVVTFTSSVPALTELEVTVRVVSTTFSASNSKIELGLLVPQPRYPKLPKARKKKDDADKKPIVQQPLPNYPSTPGGTIPPPRPPVTTLPSGWSGVGRNNAGELGTGDLTNPTTSWTSTQRGEIPSNRTIVKMCSSQDASVILLDNGDVYGFGRRTSLSWDGSVIETAVQFPRKLNFSGVQDIWTGSSGTSEGYYKTQLSDLDNKGVFGIFLKLSSNEVVNANGKGYRIFPSTIKYYNQGFLILNDNSIWLFNPRSPSGVWVSVTITDPNFDVNDIFKVSLNEFGTGRYYIGYVKSSEKTILRRVSNSSAITNATTNVVFGATISSEDFSSIGTNIVDFAANNYGGTLPSFFVILNGILLFSPSGQSATTTFISGQGNTNFTEIHVVASGSSGSGWGSLAYWLKDAANRVWFAGRNSLWMSGIDPSTYGTTLGLTRYVTSSTVAQIAAGDSYTHLLSAGGVVPAF